nr:PaaI family thioesterase [Leptospira ognonensis]
MASDGGNQLQTLNKIETDKILREMSEGFQAGARKITVPPPSFIDMKAEIIQYVKNKSISVSFPVMSNQTNPMGFMQGGYIAAAFDNAYGPLSYLVAKKPTTTIDMNIQYIRGVEPNQRVIVTATIEAKGFSTIHMTAEMKTEKEKLLATSTTNLLILKIPSVNAE